MPTLPMHHSPMMPSGWHRSFAPGGYESWLFQFADDKQDVRAVLTWFDGMKSDLQYVQDYRDYLRRPTRRTPPVARDFPGVEFRIWRKGEVLDELVRRFARGAFQGAANQIRIGESWLKWDDGVVRVRVRTMRSSVEMMLRHHETEPHDRVEGKIVLNSGEVILVDGVGSLTHEFGVITSSPARAGISARFLR